MKISVIHQLRDLLRIVPNGTWTVDRLTQKLSTPKGEATLKSDDIPPAELSAMLDLLVTLRSTVTDIIQENMILREENEVFKSSALHKNILRTEMKIKILDECRDALRDITPATPSARNVVRQLKSLLKEEKIIVRNEQKKAQFILQPKLSDFSP